MKRLLSAVLVFCLSLSAAFSQSGPSEEDVLQKARDAYSSSGSEAADDDGTTPSISIVAVAAESAEDDAAEFAPLVVQFVPGIGFPFGINDSLVAAGIVGCAVNDIDGLEAASVFCLADSVFGLQDSGVFNLAGGVEGAQFAGVFNMAGGVEGAQFAGVFNIAGEVEGAQVAGVFNMAGEVEGAQVAGVFNMAGEVEGAQVAGVLNVADRVSGLMIGLVNIAGECDGIAIGLVNIIDDGMHDWGLSWDAVSDFAILSYQTGTRDLYTVFYAGSPLDAIGDPVGELLLGFGIGTRLVEDEGSFLDLDISSEGVVPYTPAGTDFDRFDCYPALRLSGGFSVFGAFELYGGIKFAFDIAGTDGYPEALKNPWGWDSSLFDLAFTVYPSLFVGLKI